MDNFAKLQKCLDLVEKNADIEYFDDDDLPDEIRCVIDGSFEPNIQKVEYFEDIKRYRAHLNCIHDLFSQDQWHDEELSKDFEELLSSRLEDLFKGCNICYDDQQIELEFIVANALKRLHKHKTLPSIAVVEKVVNHFSGFDEMYEYEDNGILISAAEQAGCNPSIALMLLRLDPPSSKYWGYRNYAPMFLHYLVQPHESDGEHADTNRLKVLKYMEVSGMLKTDIGSRYSIYDCDSNFPQVFDFLCSVNPNELMHGFRCDFCSSTKWPCHFCNVCSNGNRFSDFPKLSNYIKAGFKYLPDIGGILFLRDLKRCQYLIMHWKLLEKQK